MKIIQWGAIALTGAFAFGGCQVDDGGAGGADSGVGGGETGGDPGTGGEAAGGNGGSIVTGGSGGALPGGSGGEPVGGSGGADQGGSGGEPVGGAGGAIAGGSGGEPVGGGGAGGAVVGGSGGEPVGGGGGAVAGGSGGEPVGGGGGAGGAEPGPCAFVECAEGTVCDPESGACIGNELPSCLEACTYLLSDCGQGDPAGIPDCVTACEADQFVERRACVLASGCDLNAIDACFALVGDLCADVVCADGEACDPATGFCEAVVAPTCDAVCQQVVDCGAAPPDALAQCVAGCDAESTPDQRICVAEAGCDQNALMLCFSGPGDLCVDVICADGESCNPDTGACEAIPVCMDDILEDNDTLETAAPVMPGAAFEALQVCAPDEDWYVIQADAGCTVFVSIDFVHADGDLDLAIMDASQMLLDVSDGVTDREEVTLGAVETGPLYINVFGLGGDANSYNMQVNEACP